MDRIRVALIAAVGDNHVIGADGGLPWRLRTDMRRFRRLTMGKPIVMGRRQWDTVGHALPGRSNLVVSRTPGLTLTDAEVLPLDALDWTGDPVEVENRFVLVHGERNYKEMLAHFEEYTDIVGDHPLNLLATTLALNAYMLTGEAKYKRWLLEYVDAWHERMKASAQRVHRAPTCATKMRRRKRRACGRPRRHRRLVLRRHAESRIRRSIKGRAMPPRSPAVCRPSPRP